MISLRLLPKSNLFVVIAMNSFGNATGSKMTLLSSYDKVWELSAIFGIKFENCCVCALEPIVAPQKSFMPLRAKTKNDLITTGKD